MSRVTNIARGAVLVAAAALMSRALAAAQSSADRNSFAFGKNQAIYSIGIGFSY